MDFLGNVSSWEDTCARSGAEVRKTVSSTGRGRRFPLVHAGHSWDNGSDLDLGAGGRGRSIIIEAVAVFTTQTGAPVIHMASTIPTVCSWTGAAVAVAFLTAAVTQGVDLQGLFVKLRKIEE